MQNIPWPSALNAEKKKATSLTNIKKFEVEILTLNTVFQAKVLIYRFLELVEKIEIKQKKIITLNNLNNVVLERLKLGTAKQSEISRINIEVAKITQSIRTMQADLIKIQNTLNSMAGDTDITPLMPNKIAANFGDIRNFHPENVDLSSHPLIKFFEEKSRNAQAEIDLAEVNHLPRIKTSLSWFKIDSSNAPMNTSTNGKDAWLIGASISIPIWGEKYNSIDRSQISKRATAELNISQQKINLQNDLKNLYEEYLSISDVLKIFTTDIIPQANQVLTSNKESYTQNNVSFERIIEDYLQVIKFEDQLIETRIKQAILKSSIEKTIGIDI